MKVENVYKPGLHHCRDDARLADAAARMRDNKLGALAVVDDHQQLVGIISERDLTRAVADRVDPAVVPVSAYATTRVVVASPDDDIEKAGSRMLEAGIRHLPVVSYGRLVGMVSMRDLLAVHTWA